jgi:hypothetical protein
MKADIERLETQAESQQRKFSQALEETQRAHRQKHDDVVHELKQQCVKSEQARQCLSDEMAKLAPRLDLLDRLQQTLKSFANA